MTKVLFSHDGYISRNQDNIYSSVYDNEIVERYKKIADNVIFLIREKKFEFKDLQNNLISSENFSVESVQNFKNIKGIYGINKINKRIEYLVKSVDYVVARIPSDLGFKAVKYARKHQIPYMLEVVGCPLDSLRAHSFLGVLLSPIYYMRQKRTVRLASSVIYVTNEFLQRRYPSTGRNIGCSDVEIPSVDKSILQKRLRKISKMKKNEFVLGTLGAINMRYKGYDTVIKAISSLNKGDYNIQYYIAGYGNTDWLNSVIVKHKADEFVKLIPGMRHEEVFSWLDNIDIYIQPSKTEGMPRALIEAMNRACPCIGSNAGGIPELINNSLVFSKGRYLELKKIIESINKDLLRVSAADNMEKTLAYRKEELHAKRMKFYTDFKNESQEG